MEKQNFNKDWKFCIGAASDLMTLGDDTSDGFSIVTLPHDASIGLKRTQNEPSGSSNGFFREENCNYTKTFILDEKDAQKNVWFEFEGVHQNAYIYINGAFAGKCPYGYGNFYVDATKYVNFTDENTIRVVVKNGIPGGRWYTGGGIYRDVNLMIADRMHLVPDSVHLSTIDLEKEQAVIRVKSTIEYTGIGVRDIKLVSRLLDNHGKIISEDVMPITVEEDLCQEYQQKMFVQNPILWDEDHPYLYQYCTYIVEQGEILDKECGTFGIRKMQLDRAHGLRINGKIVKLRGGCIHHDNGVIGAAEYTYAAEERVRKLKQAGYNAIRSAHYPMSRKLLEACDKFGMYVMEEYTDVWTSTKMDFDYGIHISEWWKHDLKNMVLKDYNHPCVIMYSIGNEIPETGNKFNVQFGKKLTDEIRKLDDSRYIINCLNLCVSVMDRLPELLEEKQKNTDILLGEKQEINGLMNSLGDLLDLALSSPMAHELVEEACAQVDITGYNYGPSCYEVDGDKYPNRIMLGSETYPRDLDTNWELVEKNSYVLGDFSWTAWDYLGEAGIGMISYGIDRGMEIYSPYPYKAAYCGDFNLIGDRRPISYWREIVWGLRSKPYLCVQPPKYHDIEHYMTNWSMSDAIRSWNWSGYEGKNVTVEVYAQADEAELLLNGKSVARKRVGETKKYIASFETIYEPGTIEVVTYQKGQENGRDIISTAKDKVWLVPSICKDIIPADGSDITYIDISLRDEKGNLNPGIDKLVQVSLEGPGILLGFGSANPESEENYFDTEAFTYEGRIRTVIRAKGEEGVINIQYRADGCDTTEVQINAV